VKDFEAIYKENAVRSPNVMKIVATECIENVCNPR